MFKNAYQLQRVDVDGWARRRCPHEVRNVVQHVHTVGEFAQWHESTPREDIGEDSYNEPEEVYYANLDLKCYAFLLILRKNKNNIFHI